jgi:predicted transcriptional regulator
MADYNKKILARRNGLRVTQVELAEAVDPKIHTASLVDIETGKVGIDMHTYRRLNAALDRIEEGRAL